MKNAPIEYIGNASSPYYVFGSKNSEYVVTRQGDTIGYLNKDGNRETANLSNDSIEFYLRIGAWVFLSDNPFKLCSSSKFSVSKGTNYLGQNGNGKVTGMLVRKMVLFGTKLMEIAPINPEGDATQCYIQLPVGEVPALIKALQEQMRQ